MRIDPKYVEEVHNEDESETEFDYGAVLNKFGVKGDFVEDASGITIPADYWERNLSQLPVGTIFAGKPYLGYPERIEWEKKDEQGKPTGEKQVNFQVKFFVIDDPSQEAYVIPINIKSDEAIHTNLYPASKLYALQMGLMELEAPGIARAYNRLDVDLDTLREILSAMDEIYFKVIEVDGGNIGKYKSFRIVSEDTLD